jgi:hypothetical protein
MAAIAAIAITVTPSSPRITGITPAMPARSVSAQLLTVIGEEFSPDLSLEVTGPDGTRQLLRSGDIRSPRESAFQVSVVLAAKGSYGFIVTNPDGGVSPSFPLVVGTGVAAPAVEAVIPSKVSVNPAPQSLRVNGKGFVPGLVVNLTDPMGTVANIRGNDVRDATPETFRVAAIFRVEGQYTLTVTNPDGGVSNALSIQVMKKQPTHAETSR